MNKTISKYQQGGIIAFVILALCVSYALYKSDTSSTKSDDATAKVAALAVANEQDRYENCIQANKAIAQLNVISDGVDELLAIGQTVPAAIENGRAEKYKAIADKLSKAAKLECLKPVAPTGSVGATGSTP